MLSENEIMDIIEDINDKNVFKCKKCCWKSYNDNIEFLCICPFSDFDGKSVKYNKGCDYYHNHDEPHFSNILDYELQGTLFE